MGGTFTWKINKNVKKNRVIELGDMGGGTKTIPAYSSLPYCLITLLLFHHGFDQQEETADNIYSCIGYSLIV